MTPVDRWITVAELAEAEGCTKRAVYGAIDQGMVHARRGRRVRVRIMDWRAWWTEAVVGGRA